MGIHKPSVAAFIPLSIVMLLVGAGIGSAVTFGARGFVNEAQVAGVQEEVSSCEEVLTNVRETLQARIASHGMCQRSFQELRTDADDLRASLAEFQADPEEEGSVLALAQTEVQSLVADLGYCNTMLAISVADPCSIENIAHLENQLDQSISSCEFKLASMEVEIDDAQSQIRDLTHPNRASGSIVLHRNGIQVRFEYCTDPDDTSDECFETQFEAATSAQSTATTGMPLDERFILTAQQDSAIYEDSVDSAIQEMYEGSAAYTGNSEGE